MTIKPAILIADDDRLSRMILCRQLVLLGHEVWEAENGSEALQLLETRGAPLMIFLDRQMPVMDGLMTMTHLRNDPAWQQIPVVMLTGADSCEKIKQGMDAGIHYYLTKPVTAEAIVPIIQSITQSS